MSDIDTRLARRIRHERVGLGLSIEALAQRSGVSRAMISKVERGDSSPTAALLGRLCAGLGISLSSLFAEESGEPNPLSRRAEQPVWRDPATGYVRRDINARGTGSPVEIVEVMFPAGARVSFDQPYQHACPDQHVWVLEGRLEVTVGDLTHELETGDCLHLRLDRPIIFHNPGRRTVRYAVVLTIGGARV